MKSGGRNVGLLSVVLSCSFPGEKGTNRRLGASPIPSESPSVRFIVSPFLCQLTQKAIREGIGTKSQDESCHYI
jgi:hypothetical protein